MEADKLTSEQADERIGNGDISFWFYEQYIWSEVERDARLLTKPVPKRYKKFLDFTGTMILQNLGKMQAE
ncbi:MAG: hypothetical protein LC100_14970 [Chitinophagales bacterium]|nr:hypothetical protein [Chitinophagales bacterium]